jgi:hypothetical protein
MNIGEAGVEEPMWVYLNFMQRVQREQWFIEHPIGIRQITGLDPDHPRDAPVCRGADRGGEWNSLNPHGNNISARN